jgi:hypothetical protein
MHSKNTNSVQLGLQAALELSSHLPHGPKYLTYYNDFLGETGMPMLNYANLRDPHFLQALRKLGDFSFPKVQTTLAVARLLKIVNSEQALCDKVFKNLLNKYAEKDESGKLLPINPKLHGTYKIPEENMEEWSVAYADFVATTFEFSFTKLALEDLSGAGLSASELLSVQELVDLPV